MVVPGGTAAMARVIVAKLVNWGWQVPTATVA
jgi:hypothetical protein